jgi:hypothetical protein
MLKRTMMRRTCSGSAHGVSDDTSETNQRDAGLWCPVPTELHSGGGGSHRRTRLRFGIPCFAGKYREFLLLEADAGDAALPFSKKFKAFLPDSLRIETGNFAD